MKARKFIRDLIITICLIQGLAFVCYRYRVEDIVWTGGTLYGDWCTRDSSGGTQVGYAHLVLFKNKHWYLWIYPPGKRPRVYRLGYWGQSGKLIGYDKISRKPLFVLIENDFDKLVLQIINLPPFPSGYQIVFRGSCPQRS